MIRLLLVGLLSTLYLLPLGSAAAPTYEFAGPVPVKVPCIWSVHHGYGWLFQACEDETGFPAEIVGRIIGQAENWTWNPKAKGPRRKDGHRDVGLCQHNTKYVKEFARRYNGGKPYDPFNPAEAVPITFRLLADNYAQLGGDMVLTVASYRQGVAGVLRDAPTAWYVDRIMGCYKEDL
jgi:hypothetical protein